MNRRYALSDEGGWWYYLEGARYSLDRIQVVGPNDAPLTAGAKLGWWWAEGEKLASVAILSTGSRPLLRADLKEGADEGGLLKSALRPTLAVHEWRALSEAGESDEYVSSTALLYRSAYELVYGEAPIVRTEVDLSGCLVLEGRPPGSIPAGARWCSQLPSELRERSEYLPLFPGHLDGLSGAVAERLSSMPGVSAYNQTTFTVYAPVKGQTCELVKAGYVKTPPRIIEGPNLATAAAEWERIIQGYVEKVKAATAVGTCPTCRGTGDVAGAVVPDEVRVRALVVRFQEFGKKFKPIRDNARALAVMALEELG